MQKRSRSNFDYRIGIFEDQNILLIWDKNLGNRSVTNDIENVVADIAAYEDVDPKDYVILYRDSEGLWDGWDAVIEDFFPMREAVSRPIVEKLLQGLQLPSSLL
jgi:hypothetical protein